MCVCKPVKALLSSGVPCFSLPFSQKWVGTPCVYSPRSISTGLRPHRPGGRLAFTLTHGAALGTTTPHRGSVHTYPRKEHSPEWWRDFKNNHNKIRKEREEKGVRQSRLSSVHCRNRTNLFGKMIQLAALALGV